MSNQIEPMEDTFEVKEMDEIEEMDQPEPSKAKKFGRSVGGWLKRHKKPMIFVLVLVVVLGGLYFFIGRPYLMRKEMAENMNQNVAFIRTTTLQKTSLADTISATGLVASNNVSTVTTNLNASVKSVEVAVGDYVEEGDVIVTLDTEEINKQITRAQEKVQENIEKAQESYDSAYTNWQKAKESYEDYESQYSTASSEYKTARTEYNTALALVQDLIDEVEETNEALQDAQYDLAALLKEKNSLEAEIAALDSGADGYDSAKADLQGELVSITDEITAAEETLDAAEEAAKSASAELTEMENLTGYSTLYKTYTTAKSAYSSAGDKLDSAEEAKDNARKNMLEAKEDLEEAQAGDSDDLEDLYDELENYTLRAETAGYITSLNATVGSRLADGTVAVIQDTDDLVITISIAEYDIDSVELGMKAIITSDSIEGEVSGTLTQIDPVASGGMSSSATFSAQVSVDGKDSGLIIGVNAAVELIISSTEDVFVVPYDAVGTNDAGRKIVYVKTGGSGVDATFEEIVVETGAETDYYIEIISSELTEGMEVRSSADLTEATYTQQEGEAAESGAFDMLMGGGNMGGGNMGGGMPSGGGMPGGNMGGGMPSGGGMPGGR